MPLFGCSFSCSASICSSRCRLTQLTPRTTLKGSPRLLSRVDAAVIKKVVQPHVTGRFCKCQAAQAYTTTGETSAARSDQAAQTKLKELQDLAQEVAGIALATGPTGVVRALQASTAIAATVGEYITLYRQGSPEPPERVLRKLFERLGATYIKLGQFIASSPTIFPEEYVLEFQKCLDKADAVPWEAVRSRIQLELQMPLEDIFAHVDPQPLATASVAQVHAAVLRNSNKEVVIKVLKPGVEDVLKTDLNFLYVASKLLEFVNPELSRTSLSAVVSDIRTSMLDEVDFQKEAVHLQHFSNYLDKSGLRSVASCPYVYKQFSSQRVLTMERLHGVALTDLQAIRNFTTADPERTLVSALNTWFGSLMNCETFHADVHAGNLLVLRDGRVGFIDFGIVGRVSPVTWKALEALSAAVVLNDYNRMARAMATMGATREEVDIEAFARDLEALVTEIKQIDSELVVAASRDGGGVSARLLVDDAQVNRLLLQLVSVGETHGIRFPREFGLLVKQMLYFDRYIRLLAPQLSLANFVGSQ